jgi:hypothetical protein
VQFVEQTEAKEDFEVGDWFLSQQLLDFAEQIVFVGYSKKSQSFLVNGLIGKRLVGQNL